MALGCLMPHLLGPCDLAAIVELQREPVPAHCSLFELRRAPFMVHPAQAARNLERSSADGYNTGRRHTCQRIIIRGIAYTLAFNTVPMIALQRRWLGTLKPEVDRDVDCAGLEPHRHALRPAAGCLPRSEPDAVRVAARACQVRSVTAEALGGVEFLAREVA